MEMEKSSKYFLGLMLCLIVDAIFYLADIIDGVWLMTIPLMYFAVHGFTEQSKEKGKK